MAESKDATGYTEEANQAILGHDHLDWEDRGDWEAAQKGFIDKLDPPIISDAEGRPVWDLNQYSFLGEESAPPTVNPSLWMHKPGVGYLLHHDKGVLGGREYVVGPGQEHGKAFDGGKPVVGAGLIPLAGHRLWLLLYAHFSSVNSNARMPSSRRNFFPKACTRGRLIAGAGFREFLERSGAHGPTAFGAVGRFGHNETPL